MTAPTGLPHLEQAKCHIRSAVYSNEFTPTLETQDAISHLIWAIDEVLRYVERRSADQL